MRLALALAFGIAVGFEIGVEQSVTRVNHCIEAWWYDGDGIVEAPWWTPGEAEASIQSQRYQLKKCTR